MSGLTSKSADVADALAQRVSPRTVIRCDEPLARRTTLRVGGPADILVEPGEEQDLSAVLQFCRDQRLCWFILGRGSNLLVKDAGYRGIVISLCSGHFSAIEVVGTNLRCGAGSRLKAVASEARRAGLAGVEFLDGIPGSIGGALRMNAGAMGSAIFSVVVSVRVMSPEGDVRECAPGELRVGYRHCEGLSEQIALSATLACQPGPRETIERTANEFNRKRWSSQPAAPSAGCIFKNPASVPAGKLIDQLGLKGTRVGGAMVSHEHGNFIINDGTATAADVLGLISLIKQRARGERGIELEPEVEIVGE
jgi:UDP-N-acetylenolpyruvoylglucosamine reductase